eukprot:TRINITY_DN119_c0_g2_i2.p1 TRINITY_DN119_c0_g2~~TRINITY_DN119_c0_g2_i2.p1  ORF type:complete len:518 (+),score=165.86 TRINITY_DN119_c0_g2_i2:87-1556(+)
MASQGEGRKTPPRASAAWGDGATGGRSTPPQRSTPPRDGERRTTPPRGGDRRATPPREGERRATPPRAAARGSTSSGAGAAAAAGPVPDRGEFCAVLHQVPFLEHVDPRFMHGRGYSGPPKPPKVTWKCDKPPRDDHSAPKWLTASEFQDEPDVVAAKCKQLADLIRMSKKTVLYTGAGISASVIGQAARSGQNTQGWKGGTREAPPTYTHHALGFLGQQGLINSWVQQNHDGLPQKAGFPQEHINEIHGSWYDPSNPVVKYSGELHDRAYPWMTEDAATADLVIVLGTSLGGLNADQVATSTAERSLCPAPWGQGGALGTVIINLQQTEQDGKMTLRMFGRSDDLLRILLHDLGFGRKSFSAPRWPKECRALVPYDASGRRLREGQGRRMWLDLSERQKVRITPGHNIQGAKQPQYMHIGAEKPVTFKGQTRQPAEGFGVVVKREDASSSFVLQIEGEQMRLGIWWLDVAQRGAVEQLPIVNAQPQFE